MLRVQSNFELKVAPMRANTSAFVTLLTAGALSLASPAAATVTEPDGRPVPIQTSEGTNLELQTLFNLRGETLNWETDALTTPSVFSPLCGFTGTLLLHGGGCMLDLGWYNAVQSGGAAPA